MPKQMKPCEATVEACLKAIGQWDYPTPRLAAPRLSGWIYGYVEACRQGDKLGTQESLTRIFEGMKNPFGNIGGNLGVTMAVEAQRVLGAGANDPMSRGFMEGYELGTAQATEAPEGIIERFVTLFG